MQKRELYGIEDYFSSFKRGEEKGFNYFFRDYFPAVLYFAQGLVTDRQLAEDLVEEAFIKLWQRRNDIIHHKAIKSYLYTVVRNSITDHMRRLKVAGRYASSIEVTANQSEPSFVEKIIEAELMDQIYTTIKTLPPKCGRVFRMYYLQGKDYYEIAEELSVSVSTVRNQNARALVLLKEKLPNLLQLLVFIFFFFL